MASDAGFSLVELLVAVVIIPVVVGALGLALISVFQQENPLANRLADSSASQLTSALYVRDVQSAAKMTTSASATAPATCGSGTTFVLGLSWGQTVVSYWVTRSGSPASYALVRNLCNNGSAVNAVGVGGVASTQGPAAITCPSCSPAGGWATGWVSTAGTQSISLSVTQSASNFSYRLQAVPRAWTPLSGGAPPAGSGPTPSLLLLGSGTNVLTLAGNNNSLTVNGGIYVNSNASGAVSVSGNNDSLTSSTFAVYNCAATPGATCTNGAVQAPGAHGSITQPISTSTATADPMAALPAPPTTSPGACTTTGSTTRCTPGVYASPVTLSGNNQSVVFGSGIYIFRGGISISGNNPTVTSDPGGVLFFVGNNLGTGGDSSAAVSFSGNNISITLSPMTAGQYPNLLLFQSRTDPATVDLTGNNPGLVALGGIIYAPAARVSLYGNNAGVTEGSILAQGLDLNGNNANIGLGQ